MISGLSYAGHRFDTQKRLADLAPDIFELFRLVKMAQQPAQAKSPPIPAAGQIVQNSGNEAMEGASQGGSPTFVSVDPIEGIASFANRISEIVKRLWNNEYGRALLLSLLIGGSGGGLLELLDGGSNSSLSSTLRSILLWSLMGVVLGVGGKFLYDWLTGDKTLSNVTYDVIADLFGKAVSNAVSGINPVPNAAKKVEESFKALQDVDKAGQGVADIASKLQDKDVIKNVFYTNLMKVVDEKQKQNDKWLGSMQQLPEDQRKAETAKVVGEAWDRTKSLIVNRLQKAYEESNHDPNFKFFGVDKLLYDLDRWFDRNVDLSNFPLADSLMRFISPSSLSLAATGAFGVHAAPKLLKGLYNQIYGGKFSDMALDRSRFYLLDSARKVRDALAANKNVQPIGVDVLSHQGGTWRPLRYLSHFNNSRFYSPFSESLGALTEEKEKPILRYRLTRPFSRLLSVGNKKVFNTMYENLKALSNELPGYTVEQINSITGLNPAQRAFLQENYKNNSLLQSLLTQFDPKTRTLGKVPHVFEFEDSNQNKHMLTARQLLNLRRHVQGALNSAELAKRHYWLPRLLLTMNPKGSYWSAIPVWGIPLLASAVFPSYFSSPEAHIKRISRNLGPAYSDDIAKKVDYSLLDRMYQEFKNSQKSGK